MERFLSCDWGSTSFRLRLVSSEDFSVLAEVRTAEGISAVYRDWKAAAQHEEARTIFYSSIIERALDELELQVGTSVSGIPLLVSGMASSTVGLRELPYNELPLFLNGSQPEVFMIPGGARLTHDLFLITGVRSATEVMRGEETMVIGLAAQKNIATGKFLIIFPGTHSKHLSVTDGLLTAFETYMTGEFFDLLSKQSLLAASVEASPWENSALQEKAFAAGVQQGATGNLLQQAFQVRTQALFGRYAARDNYYFLSGLLIGSELQNRLPQQEPQGMLVSDYRLGPLYAKAAQLLGLNLVNNKTGGRDWIDADQCLLRGQWTIYKQHA